MVMGNLSGSNFEFNTGLSECKDSVPMSPADELFCNGHIRPMKPSTVPQKTPLPNFEHRSKAQSSMISKKGNDTEEKNSGRQRLWSNEKENRHRCTARALSPQRNSSHWEGKGKVQRYSGLIDDSEEEVIEGIKVVSAASPLASPKPRGSRRTWSLRDFFLLRNKSEGREKERDEKELAFSSYAKLSSSDKDKKRASAQGKPAHKKKTADTNTSKTVYISSPSRKGVPVSSQELHYISSPNRKWVTASAQELHYISSPNRMGVRVSAHELHYTVNRAQAEELRRKTFLPYRQGLLGCVRFPSPPAIPQDHVLPPLHWTSKSI